MDGAYANHPGIVNHIINHQRHELARELVKRISPGQHYVVRLDEDWRQSYRPYVYKERVASLTLYPTETQHVRFASPEYNKMSWWELERSALKEIQQRLRHKWMMLWRSVKGIIRCKMRPKKRGKY